VRVESEIGRGSTFRVTLPPAVMDSPSELVNAPTPEVAAQGGRLLVIDDEPMILGALRRSLSAEYNVTCVGDGRKALERLRSGERYALILCDLMMPEMTGMDLFAELEKVAPDQASRMVFVSGGAFTPRAREFLERVPNARVEKPIDLQNLRLLLRNLVR
jgi:CheY-like chemotaxis protein